MYNVCALGELLIDFTPSGLNDQGVSLFGRNPGGAPANVLAMLSKLGGRTVFIGKVGRDDFGSFLEKTIQDAGVDTAGLTLDPAYLTTLAFVHLSETGDRSFSFYRRQGADLMLRWEELNLSLIDESDVFHFGSVSLSGQPCRDTLHQAVHYAKSKGKIISYDPNYRPLLWPDQDEAKTEIAKLLDQTDILKVSEEEMALLTGVTDLEKGSGILAEKGPLIVLVTMGENGTWVRCPTGCGAVPAYAVQTVDTTGAGDAFFGAVHYRLINKTLGDLRRLSLEELEDIVDFANAAGGLVTTKRGAIPALPSLFEIEAGRRQFSKKPMQFPR
jgi:fructokinase